MKKLVYVCSPCRPTSDHQSIQKLEKARNMALAKIGCLKVVEKDGIPVAPHLYFTQFLNDETPEEREIGMALGLDILDYCDELWVFTNGVISDGMMTEIKEAADLEIPVRMFDAEGNENRHIQDLVDALKEEEPEKDEDDADESDNDEDEEPGYASPEDELTNILFAALFAMAKDQENREESGKHTAQPHVKEIRITRVGEE